MYCYVGRDCIFDSIYPSLYVLAFIVVPSSTSNISVYKFDCLLGSELSNV